MIKLILITLLSCAFFSSTYILNEFMSALGGHWFWSASLRYLFTLLILTLIIAIQHGYKRIIELWNLFLSHYKFWVVTGSIGFGIFYAGLCYAADHVSGWIVAATFMFTVVASLIVLIAFGHTFAKKFIVYAVLVFVGVILVNLSEAFSMATDTLVSNPSIVTQTPLSEVIIYGALPCFIAAFSYPLGSQLVWQASYNARAHNAKQLNKQHKLQKLKYWSVNNDFQPLTTLAPRIIALEMDDYIHQEQTTVIETEPLPTSKFSYLVSLIPTIKTNLLRDSFNKVWLMTLGSAPFWLILGIIIRPTLPDISQVTNTFLVALLSGVIATSLFLYAREQANTASEVAGVDATQASEVIFALIGGMIFLNNMPPSPLGVLGIVLIITGLLLFAKDG